MATSHFCFMNAFSNASYVTFFSEQRASWPRPKPRARGSLIKTIPLSLAVIAFLATEIRGQSADSFDPNPNSAVSAIAVQPDGKIIVGGGFTTLSPNGGAPVLRNYIARLNPEGTVDAEFDPNANGSVGRVVSQSDGKIVVAGGFTNIGGQARRGIARLDGATGMADSFDPPALGGQHPSLGAMAVQADGKVLIGGYFESVGGQPRVGIARLDATTGLPDSFDPGLQGATFHYVTSIAVQGDGKILVGGYFDHVGGQFRNKIARVNADGTLDT